MVSLEAVRDASAVLTHPLPQTLHRAASAASHRRRRPRPPQNSRVHTASNWRPCTACRAQRTCGVQCAWPAGACSLSSPTRPQVLRSRSSCSLPSCMCILSIKKGSSDPGSFFPWADCTARWLFTIMRQDQSYRIQVTYFARPSPAAASSTEPPYLEVIDSRLW